MSKTEPFERHTEQYENWFEVHEAVYQSELEAVKMLMPEFRKGVEIGTGTGRFSAPLGIKHGLEPSPKMREIAVKRGIEVIEGVAEDLPFEDCSFDLALMVTTICFLDDLDRSFKEVNRILEPGGVFITGFVESFFCGHKSPEIRRSVLYCVNCSLPGIYGSLPLFPALNSAGSP